MTFAKALFVYRKKVLQFAQNTAITICALLYLRAIINKTAIKAPMVYVLHTNKLMHVSTFHHDFYRMIILNILRIVKYLDERANMNNILTTLMRKSSKEAVKSDISATNKRNGNVRSS